VHLSDQTAKFKAFKLNEMNAISAILAESEFVCTQKGCGFPLLTFLKWYLPAARHRGLVLNFDIFVTWRGA
jgi:hypothetical protein